MQKKVEFDSAIYRLTADVHSKAMTRGEYNKYRGWTIPSNENPDDEGYFIEHVNNVIAPNDERHAGHITWIPKALFESTYRLVIA